MANAEATVRASNQRERPKAVAFKVDTGLWVPKVGFVLVVDLPGERLRATVAKVVTPDTAIVELTYQPLSKSHSYALGDFVPVARALGTFGEEVWRSFKPKPRLADAEPKPAPTKKRAPCKKKAR